MTGRDPSANPTPLDWASFYVEGLKYGPGPGQLEAASGRETADQLEALLRDAVDGFMHGIALAGGVVGEHRDPRRTSG